MKNARLIPAVVSAALMIAGSCAVAADAGDPAEGKRKTTMCIGCHGIGGYKTVFP